MAISTRFYNIIIRYFCYMFDIFLVVSYETEFCENCELSIKSRNRKRLFFIMIFRNVYFGNNLYFVNM